MEESVRNLSDDELRNRLKTLAREERRITTELIAHLSEYDERKLWRTDGLGSLWSYCTTALGFSEQEAYARIRVARAVQSNRSLLSMLEHGDTTISAVYRLAAELRTENSGELLEEIKGKSKRDVEWIAARERVAKITDERRSEAIAEAEIQADLFAQPVEQIDAAIRAELIDRRDRIEPLTDEDARITFISDRALVAKLERTLVVFARRHPKGRFAEIIGDALDLLLDREDPARRVKRRAARDAKRAEIEKVPIAHASAGRAVPRALRDAVLERDGYQCAYRDPDGSRCQERKYLEADHILAAALGGKTELRNLRTLCRRHNQGAAVQAFGAERIDAAITARRQAAATQAVRADAPSPSAREP